MSSGKFWLNRLSVRLTIAFLLASVLGVALVAVFTYNSTAREFNSFLAHLEGMSGMGGMMGGPVTQAGLEFVRNLGRNLWLAGIMGALLALVLGGLFTRYIVAPLGEVSGAARSMAAGDFDRRVNVRGSSELVELGESFNYMAETLNRDRDLRQNMVADIAHELRTPLSILQANIEAMQDKVLETSPENLESLHQETVLLSRLIEDLRTLSLAESGQLKLQPEETDLEDLARKVAGSIKPQFASRNITLEVNVSGDVLKVMADRYRVEQVLRNLLNNALQYTPENGRVSVKVAKAGKMVETTVTDSGPGIPPDDLPHIFERFYRVDRSRTRRTGGSGLGLAIVKQLVEAQGGSVSVSSEVGRGSTFTFCLPVFQENPGFAPTF